MQRYWVLRDDQIIGATSTHEEAVEMIRAYQARETHYMLRANFAIIYGEYECVGY